MENQWLSSKAITDQMAGCANFRAPFNQTRKQNNMFQHGDVEMSA